MGSLAMVSCLVPNCKRPIVRKTLVTVSDGELSDGGVISPIRNPYDIKHEICRRHQDDCALGPPLPLQNLDTCARRDYSGSVDYGLLVCSFLLSIIIRMVAKVSLQKILNTLSFLKTHA